MACTAAKAKGTEKRTIRSRHDLQIWESRKNRNRLFLHNYNNSLKCKWEVDKRLNQSCSRINDPPFTK